ncbi:winged helix-turn-helix transcriptional regulator [Gordonia aurantiaca]|uniref:winged helix-turn-helix transcriptional regulator n=1 Tax=Gordonia sp. B21 TaxID=3151852 RepID=UPI0032643D11
MAHRATYTELEPGGDNAIAVTLGALGDEWNLWILRYAIAGCRRYGDWMEQGPISNSVLSGRLARLTDLGLFEKVRYSERPVRHEYVLTRRGVSVWPILLGMWAWEASWAPVSDAPLPGMRHSGCGRYFSPVLVCGSCGGEITRRDVAACLGPSGDWSRSVPASIGRRRSSSVVKPSQLLPHTMELLGNRWSAAMLGALLLGATRFGELAERTGAPPAMVADRLRRFTELGVITTEPVRTRPDWVAYRLTDKGEAFFPVVVLMIAWGQRWFRAPEGPAIVFTHRECGQRFEPRLICSECGQALHASEVLVEDEALGHRW